MGGPFTRYNPSDPDNESKKSILSLCIVSNDLVKFIDSLIIDKDKEFTPYRVVSNNKVVYTDHYSAMLKFEDLPIKSHIKEGKVRKVSRSNTKKDDGWKTYKELTSENQVLEGVASLCDVDTIEKTIDTES